jgi:diaminopimelate epimerase
MELTFYKYQGAGNDFVLIDNRKGLVVLSTQQINWICKHRFGVGADGLILLEESDKSDFKMIYFNADGALGSMCGNGGRCVVAFAHYLGLFSETCIFEAFDGFHNAEVLEDERVVLEMSDVTELFKQGDNWQLDTGSPHLVCFTNSVDEINVKEKGAEIRYSEQYKEKGINVNFIQLQKNKLIIRTYERGVEDETLACGTGATAAAIAAFEAGLLNVNKIELAALGGDLEVSFTKNNNKYTNVCLVGAANFVFKGTINV